MKIINFRQQLTLSLAALGLVLILESFTDIDLLVQKFFYDPDTSAWLISPEAHRRLRPFFYDGPKITLAVIGLTGLACFVLSFKFKPLKNLRRPSLTLFLSLALAPLIVAGSKQITNIHCPRDLICYNGSAPYERVLAAASPDRPTAERGKCFPAGHASGGFALMALFFCFKNAKARRAALAFAVTAGWTMGLYQMFRGEHFISHTLASMTASWAVIITINDCIKYFPPGAGTAGRGKKG